jgi:hypothetical protein
MMYGGTAGMERLLQFGKLQQLPEMIWKSMSFYIQIPSLLAQALGPADVVQKLKLHLETTHKLGEPASQTPDSGVDWSEDKQRELDRILDEIESEEAQEEPSSGSGDEGLDDVEGEQD